MHPPTSIRGLPLPPHPTRSNSQDSSIQDLNTDSQSPEGSYKSSHTSQTHVSSVAKEECPRLPTRSDRTLTGGAALREHQHNDALNCKAEVVSTENLTKEDVIVLVMGRTGSGKRTFINAAVGVQDWTSQGPGSSTDGIQAVRITFGDSTRVVLANTPSFEPDLTVLTLLSGWLTQIYGNGLFVSGVLFLHRISCDVAPNLARQHLMILKALCGEDMYRKLVVVTTMWQDVEPRLGDDRESKLGKSYRATMTNGGSKTFRLGVMTQRSAREILDYVRTQKVGGGALQIQKELVDLKKDLLRTWAAKELYYVVTSTIAEQKHRLKYLKEEISRTSDPGITRGLTAELTRLEELHKETAVEERALDSSWTGRLRRLFQPEKSSSLALQCRVRFLVSSAVMDPRQRARMRDLTGDDAQQIVNYLGLILHKTGSLTSEQGMNQLSLLGELAKTARVYPRCYPLIKGVKHEAVAIDGGSFSDIHKGKYKGQAICLKIIRAFGKRENAHLILRVHVKELVLWAHLSHPNILPFYGVYLLGERICMVSPWIENGNLCGYLKRHHETPCMPLLLDVIAGLEHLHKSNVVHGDLKAENILVSDDRRALIADFGLSHVATVSKLPLTKTSNGTVHWRAPELLELANSSGFMRPTSKSDIWSFGCLCYEVLTGKMPFYQYPEYVLNTVLHREEIPLGPSPGEDGRVIDIDMWSIMKECWKFTPKDRPTCKALHSSIIALRVRDDRPPVSSPVQDPRAFWKAMKAESGDKFDYQRVEEILLRIQG